MGEISVWNSSIGFDDLPRGSAPIDDLRGTRQLGYSTLWAPRGHGNESQPRTKQKLLWAVCAFPSHPQPSPLASRRVTAVNGKFTDTRADRGHPHQQVFLHMKAKAELERDELTLSNVCGNIRTLGDFEGERIRTGRMIDGRRQLLVSGEGSHPEKGRALYLATSDQPIEKIVQLDPGESLIYRFYFEK